MSVVGSSLGIRYVVWQYVPLVQSFVLCQRLSKIRQRRELVTYNIADHSDRVI
jgi:hypothetical protein